MCGLPHTYNGAETAAEEETTAWADSRESSSPQQGATGVHSRGNPNSPFCLLLRQPVPLAPYIFPFDRKNLHLTTTISPGDYWCPLGPLELTLKGHTRVDLKLSSAGQSGIFLSKHGLNWAGVIQIVISEKAGS